MSQVLSISFLLFFSLLHLVIRRERARRGREEKRRSKKKKERKKRLTPHLFSRVGHIWMPSFHRRQTPSHDFVLCRHLSSSFDPVTWSRRVKGEPITLLDMKYDPYYHFKAESRLPAPSPTRRERPRTPHWPMSSGKLRSLALISGWRKSGFSPAAFRTNGAQRRRRRWDEIGN